MFARFKDAREHRQDERLQQRRDRHKFLKLVKFVKVVSCKRVAAIMHVHGFIVLVVVTKCCICV